MNVLSVAYPLLPVSADSTGGAEQILALLEKGIVQRGHRSFVVAALGSRVSGELIPTPVADGEMTEKVRQEAQAAHQLAIEEALKKYQVHLIHFHGLDFYSYLPHSPVPKLATLHLPPDWYPPETFDLSGVQFNCVSRTQATSVPRSRNFPVIPNGIDTDKFCTDSERTGPLSLVRQNLPGKRYSLRPEVAHQLNLSLNVAGPVYAFRDHETYFRERVEPLLDEQRRWLGAVNMQQKIVLLAEARALLITSLAAETSSLVAMEAIGSGTPVIAFHSGALPEIVEHGVTGFIVDGPSQMADAIKHLAQISSVVCRDQAIHRFSADRMVTDYMNLYLKHLVPVL